MVPVKPTLIGLFARCAPHRALATHRGTIALRRLLKHGRGFASLSVSGITRLLTAKASPAYGLARPRALAPAADPLRLSAGGAFTAPPQALTFSVASWLDPESSNLVAFRLREPESSLRRKPAGQARVHHTPVRATQYVRTRTPLIASTPPFGGVDRFGST
jgi:hypothetical protein